MLDDFSYANPTRSNRVLERFARVVEVPQVRFYTAIDLLAGDGDQFGYRRARGGYAPTRDAKVVAGKTYYARGGGSYVAVASPSEAELSTYFEPVGGGRPINFMVVEKSAVIKFDKHVASRVFSPDELESLDSYMMKYRNSKRLELRYQAAYELASESQGIADDTKTMILAARDRLNLQGSLPAKVFARSAICYSPNDLLGEYLSVMEVRLEQGHWADFVRLLTPAFTELCKETLRHELPEQSYLQVDKSRPTSKLNWSAIDHNIRLSRVFDRWNMRRPLYITNEMLAALIDEYCEDVATRDKLEKLRRFERNCRNKLAHELKASSKESLERIGGLTLDEVLAYLFDLHGNMREHLYADISQSIVDRL